MAVFLKSHSVKEFKRWVPGLIYQNCVTTVTYEYLQNAIGLMSTCEVLRWLHRDLNWNLILSAH